MTEILYDNIPPILTEYRQWVLWRYEQRRGQTKPTKVPYNPHNHRKAESNNPDTWGDYAQVCQAMQHGKPRYDGIGFVVTADDPFCGIDLDDCFNPETGEINAQAAEILQRIDSYTEITVSGTGLRIWLQGVLPPGKRRVGHIEMYDSVRFFTVTGHILAGSPGEVLLRQAALTALHEDVFPPSPPQPSARKSPNVPLSLSDQEVLHRAQEARNGAKFRTLYYQGDPGSDHSAADQALCNLLAFWTGGDAATMDRLFRGSALMRDKWDKRHNADGSTYGQMTINRALRDCHQVYAPGQDDGFVLVAKAAEALGVSRQAIHKRLTAGHIPVKRTERGALLVHLASLIAVNLSTCQPESCQPVNQNGVNPSTETGESCQPVNLNTGKSSTCQPESRQPVNQNPVNLSTCQPVDDDGLTTDIYDSITPPTTDDETPDDADDRVISNNLCTWIQTDKGRKPVYFARRLRDIYAQILDATGGWPRRVGTMLFFDRDSEIQFLEKHPDMFAWLADYGAISWRTGVSQDNTSFVTKEELLAYAAAHSAMYENISPLPHEPSLPGHYYSWRPVDYTPTGEHFETLLSYFTNAETIYDKLFIRAMFMTPCWGGPLKERPAFAITAPDRGCGKSTLADAVGMLYGGLIDINLSKRAEEEILQRLLTPSARLQRIVRLDNIKGEVNSPLLDALITATHVSGKQMYKGEAKRPNTLVYLLTGNGLRLSRDMAERCFILHLSKPEYVSDWSNKISQYINQYQPYILMDIMAELRKPITQHGATDRWMSFVTEVLSRCTDDPTYAAAAVIANNQRRSSSDTDIEEAEILLETIQTLKGEYVSRGWWFVSRPAVVAACNDALNTHMPTRTILAILREHVTAGRMHGQLKCDQKVHGGRRGLMYFKDEEGLLTGAHGA